MSDSNVPSAETLYLMPFLFNRMNQNDISDFKVLQAKLSYWNALGREVPAAIAEALINKTHSVDELYSIITNFVSRYASNPYGVEAGFNESHGDGRVLLSNKIRYGVELIERGKTSRLINVDDAKAALAKLGGRLSLLNANSALEALVATPVATPVSSDLPRTTDPVEVLRRAETPEHYTYQGNATVEVGTDLTPKVEALRQEQLVKYLADSNFTSVDRDALKVLALTGNGTDPLDYKDLSFSDFVAALTVVTGLPGDGTER